MGEQRRRTRITSKIDQLPEGIKNEIDDLLLDSTVTYAEIAEYLNTRGYEISKSAVGRYAIRQNSVASRLKEAQERTKVLVKAVQQNPDLDYTQAGMQILMDSLIERISLAQEEFDDMPLDKAGQLITAISRTNAYKIKVRTDIKNKLELAFEKFEEQLMTSVKNHPDLAKKLQDILVEAKERMFEEGLS
ncbi:phage protein Gp27 family protein [Vallitalea guaymasensis]|uniref:phage protein Gp27 family protein n=1 Tax=Vallitalea guaymasensis TaxID=1185412 RepID=UPI000DE20A90|nr:phage protein Gp27 family protein [Vallitalea guaymasensis]